MTYKYERVHGEFINKHIFIWNTKTKQTIETLITKRNQQNLEFLKEYWGWRWINRWYFRWHVKKTNTIKTSIIMITLIHDINEPLGLRTGFILFFLCLKSWQVLNCQRNWPFLCKKLTNPSFFNSSSILLNNIFKISTQKIKNKCKKKSFKKLTYIPKSSQNPHKAD